MGRLEQIALALYTTAEQVGIGRYRLQRGLALTLRRDNTPPGAGGDWVLSLGRDGKAPCELEEQICRRAFGLPDEVTRLTAEIENWRLVRFRWPAHQVVQLQLVAPGEAGAYYQEGL